MSSEQSEAEKAAEEYFLSMMEDIPGDIHEVPPKTLHIPIKEMPPLIRNAFLAGAAWAAPKWISVKERLPPDEEVLVVWDGIVCSGWYTPENGHLPACWDISGRNLPVDVTEVTHWMLKPAAPEVEK